MSDARHWRVQAAGIQQAEAGDWWAALRHLDKAACLNPESSEVRMEAGCLRLALWSVGELEVLQAVAKDAGLAATPDGNFKRSPHGPPAVVALLADGFLLITVQLWHAALLCVLWGFHPGRGVHVAHAR